MGSLGLGLPEPPVQNGEPWPGFPKKPMQNGEPWFGFCETPMQNGDAWLGFRETPMQNGEPWHGFCETSAKWGSPDLGSMKLPCKIGSPGLGLPETPMQNMEPWFGAPWNLALIAQPSVSTRVGPGVELSPWAAAAIHCHNSVVLIHFQKGMDQYWTVPCDLIVSLTTCFMPVKLSQMCRSTAFSLRVNLLFSKGIGGGGTNKLTPLPCW